MTEAISTAYREDPAFFPATGETLFGILTRPTGPARDIGIIMITGGGHLTLVQRNRMFVRLARRAAGLGCHALRFDFRGTGESSGLVDRFSLEDLFDHDVEGAVQLLRSEGVNRVILMGTCFGGRSALVCAARSDAVEGVVLVSPPVWDVPRGDPPVVRKALRLSLWRRLGALPGARSILQSGRVRDLRRWGTQKARRAREARAERARERDGDEWVGSGFLRPLAKTLDRGIPMLFVFGEEDELYRDFAQARQGRLGRMLEAAGSQVRVEVFPGRVHGFDTIASQDGLIDEVVAWLETVEARRQTREGSS
jgi:pimeloyl-ACP methyl ester carboxylesterase